jgi:molybdopterin synthase catalytic subunit
MDELKRSVPIWKQERFEDGGSEWVEGTRLG